MKIALWIANRHRPFSIVEDTELLEIFKDLSPTCESPTCHTSSRDVKEIFSLSRGEVGVMLQVRSVFLCVTQLFYFGLQKYPGMLHVAADGWTSPNVIAFIGTSVHWIIDGKIASIILDFIK